MKKAIVKKELNLITPFGFTYNQVLEVYSFNNSSRDIAIEFINQDTYNY